MFTANLLVERRDATVGRDSVDPDIPDHLKTKGTRQVIGIHDGWEHEGTVHLEEFPQKDFHLVINGEEFIVRRITIFGSKQDVAAVPVPRIYVSYNGKPEPS